MSWTRFGFVAWAGAALVILFQGISGLMKFNASWTRITLGSFTNNVMDKFIVKIPYESVSNPINYIVNTMELFVLLIIVGFICVILGVFKKV